MSEYIDKIKELLLSYSDEANREKVSRLISGAKTIGVPVPKIRQLAKDCKAGLSSWDFEDICQTADKFFEDECRDEILFAIFIVSQQKKNFGKISWERINRWLAHIDNWETCDQLSSNIVTFIIIDKPELVDELFELTQSENKWKRRFSATTMANLNHAGRRYPGETFRIIKPLLTDKEIMVTKAVGWALREIGDCCPDETFNFLKENSNIISKRLLKESIQTLPENYKAKLTNPGEKKY